MPETALVTGGNRGLGLECCRQLAARGFSVLLASRDGGAGAAAADGLKRDGHAVEACVLDVTDRASIEALAQRLAGEKRVLHALVNNAGVLPRGGERDARERTLATNYFGAVALTEALLPRLPAGGRVVMVSSGLGELRILPRRLRERLLDPKLEVQALDALLRGFVAGEREAGWPDDPYGVSKVGLNAYVRVRAPELAARGVRLNAVCPGWVRTDMGGRGAPRSVEQGAAGIVWAATLPPDGPSGGFFRDGRPVPW